MKISDKKIMDKFLEPYEITRYRVSEITKVPLSTLQNTNNREVKSWKVEVIQALAEVSNLTPGQTLDVLLALERDDDIEYTVSSDELLESAIKDMLEFGADFKVYPVYKEYKELDFKYIIDYIHADYFSIDTFDSFEERKEILKLNKELTEIKKSGQKSITIKKLIDELEMQKN